MSIHSLHAATGANCRQATDSSQTNSLSVYVTQSMWANGLFFHVPRVYISVVPLLEDKTALCLPARQSCIQEILPFWPDGDFFVVLPLNILTKCCNREWQTANSTKPDFYSLGRIHQRWKQYYWLSRMQMNWLPKREVEEVSILWVHARAVREREREGGDRGKKKKKKQKTVPQRHTPKLGVRTNRMRID